MVKHIVVYGALIILFLNCKEEKSLLSKSVRIEKFKEFVGELFAQGDIDCQQYRDYLDYPIKRDEVEGKQLKEILESIDNTDLSYFNNYNLDIDSVKVNLNSDIEINDIDLILNLLVKNDFKEKTIRVSNVKIDVWTSKFTLLGTYTFEEVVNSTAPSDSTILNQLVIKQELINEDVQRAQIQMSTMDYSCLRFKLKSLKIEH